MQLAGKVPSPNHWIAKEFPLECKEIQPVHPVGDQSWVFVGRTDAEAETPILWPPDAKYWLIGKDPDAGQDWRQEEKGTRENEMVRWHHQLDGHEFEQTLGFDEGQGSLACCSPWDHKESDMTATEVNWMLDLKKICIALLFLCWDDVLRLPWKEAKLAY